MKMKRAEFEAQLAETELNQPRRSGIGQTSGKTPAGKCECAGYTLIAKKANSIAK
jgi:hypothetical protein